MPPLAERSRFCPKVYWRVSGVGGSALRLAFNLVFDCLLNLFYLVLQAFFFLYGGDPYVHGLCPISSKKSTQRRKGAETQGGMRVGWGRLPIHSGLPSRHCILASLRLLWLACFVATFVPCQQLFLWTIIGACPKSPDRY